ncbi:MAG: LPS export ABC transporter ATP-binding protein, partial [Duncaniella sp.]|nr:LPS export ABC transporter ATP-binding protein [Duncaniella sp.]
ETLRITDRAYLSFEGPILFQGTSEELAENQVVREKYLGRDFMFYRKKFDYPDREIGTFN